MKCINKCEHKLKQVEVTPANYRLYQMVCEKCEEYFMIDHNNFTIWTMDEWEAAK
ncbi:hypothetical protein LCGC14_1366400 [marine sediment metagenome]|uniref:Uncharacterized protein n=1 Tax=marine sediment metagenome TaxID=412755 RepID=A0A0F9KSL4_9ZZZZ